VNPGSDEEFTYTPETNSPKKTDTNTSITLPSSTTHTSTSTTTIEHKLSIEAKKQPIASSVLKFQIALDALLAAKEELAMHERELVTQYLKEQFGLHSAHSYELISDLTMPLAAITREILRPDPEPLSGKVKDKKAYLALREQLSAHPSLQELIDEIWNLSSFINIGKNIGIPKHDNRESKDIQLSAITLNGAWLPEYLGGLIQFNPFLRHNIERVSEVIVLFNAIMENITTLDFIFFQEAWKHLLSEGSTRTLLKDEFVKRGYQYFGDEGDHAFSMGAGLLGFSKHPIYDKTYEKFVIRRIGTETIAHKKVAAARVIINNKYSLTVVTTHTTSGDGIFKRDVEIIGSTSEMRDKEQQIIHNLLTKLENEPIIDLATGLPLPSLGVIFSGDLNTPLEEIYQFLGESQGGSFNNRQKGDIKGEGMINNFLGFFSSIPKSCWPIPKNSINTKIPKACKMPGRKPLDPELEKEAKEKNLATGSTFPVSALKKNKANGIELTLQETEHSILDVVAMKPKKKGMLKAFESYLIRPLNHEQKAMSDHMALLGIGIFSPPGFVENSSFPEPTQPSSASKDSEPQTEKLGAGPATTLAQFR
jgi:hypothetical protein